MDIISISNSECKAMNFISWAKANNLDLTSDDVNQITSLRLGGLDIQSLPSCIQELKNLVNLEICGCPNLEVISLNGDSFPNLYDLHVWDCPSLNKIENTLEQ